MDFRYNSSIHPVRNFFGINNTAVYTFINRKIDIFFLLTGGGTRIINSYSADVDVSFFKLTNR